MRKRKIWNGRKDIGLPFLFTFLFLIYGLTWLWKKKFSLK